jgi:tetratricopeptide (TPR) repeat protein
VFLSLLTRPVFILLAAVVPVCNWLHLKGRRQLVASVAFLVPILLGLILFAAYTAGKGAAFPPPLMNPGVVFFEGNNPLATGNGAAYLTVVNDLAEDFPGESDYQHAVYRQVARQDAGAQFTPTEVNRFWSAKGVNFLVDEPAHAFVLMMNKAFFIGHGFRWHDIRAAAMVDKLLHARLIPFVPLGPVVALALFGMVCGLRRWRDFLLPYTICASQTGLMLVTYASDRQRLALLPFLVMFAVLGLKTLLAERRRLWLVGLGILLLAGILSRDTEVMRDNREVWANYDRFLTQVREAQVQRDAGQLSLAVKTTAGALTAAPWASEGEGKISGLPISHRALAVLALVDFNTVRADTPTAQLDRALLMIAVGRLEEADQSLVALEAQGCRFERSINRPATLSYYRGWIANRRGDRAGAVELLKQALAEAPGDPDVLAQLAALTGDRSYVARLERYFDRFDAYYYLGRAFLENGDAVRAAETLQPLQQHLPNYWKGKMYLAAAKADAHQDLEATESFIAAMRQRSEPAMFQEKILPAFRRLAEVAPPEKSTHFWYGKVLRHFGLYAEARTVLRASLAASGRPEVAEELRGLDEFMRGVDLR